MEARARQRAKTAHIALMRVVASTGHDKYKKKANMGKERSRWKLVKKDIHLEGAGAGLFWRTEGERKRR